MYYDILRIVEEVTGVTAKEMLTSNAEENVDARHILVYVLGNRGLELFQMLDFLDVTRILPTGIAVGMYSGYCCFIYSILSGIMG